MREYVEDRLKPSNNEQLTSLTPEPRVSKGRENAIDKRSQNKPRYPLDSDLSEAQGFPPLEQPGSGCQRNLS